MRILGGLGSVAVGLTVAVVFLLINGGYVYRTKCPLSSGGTQTNWTYGIDDILPYIRSTSYPCKSHTGTRLLLSAVGIAKINDGGSNTAPASNVTPTDAAAAEALATATSAITAEFDNERRTIAPLQTAIKSQGLTPAVKQKLLLEIERAANRMQAIKRTLDSTAPANDSELAETQRVLSLWLARQVEGDRVILTASTNAEFERRTTEVARKIQPLSRRLQTLSVEIQAKYPNVTDWGFLPNS
jgi:hypothetical protein